MTQIVHRWWRSVWVDHAETNSLFLFLVAIPCVPAMIVESIWHVPLCTHIVMSGFSATMGVFIGSQSSIFRTTPLWKLTLGGAFAAFVVMAMMDAFGYTRSLWPRLLGVSFFLMGARLAGRWRTYAQGIAEKARQRRKDMCISANN